MDGAGWDDGFGRSPGRRFYIRAEATSANGHIFIGQSMSASGTETCIWDIDEGTLLRLGDLPGGRYESNALAMSAAGDFVVGNASVEGPDQEFLTDAFLWTEGQGMRSLKDVLETDFGLDLTGW